MNHLITRVRTPRTKQLERILAGVFESPPKDVTRSEAPPKPVDPKAPKPPNEGLNRAIGVQPPQTGGRPT